MIMVSPKGSEINELKDIVGSVVEKNHGNKRLFVLLAAVLFLIAALILSTVLFPDNGIIPPIGPLQPIVPVGSCSNGLMDLDEEGVDCGGICPEPCVPVDSCSNGVQDAGEEGVDCGGPCAVCLVKQSPYEGFFAAPVSVADIAIGQLSGSVYVVDETRHRVMIFDSDFKHIDNIGEEIEIVGDTWEYKSGSKEQGKLFFPAAIALSSGGKLFVLDRTPRVQVFSRGGAFEKELLFEENILETLPMIVDTLHIDGAGLSIALDESNRIYISDELSSTVALFSPELKLINSIGGRNTGSGQLVFPGQVSYSNGKVFVADSGNARVQVFDSELNFVASITDGLRQPTAVMPANDKIYVADGFDNKIKLFNESYGLESEYGGLGIAQGQFYNVASLKTDSSGNIFVAEAGNVRVQRFDKAMRFNSSLDGILGGDLLGFAPFYVAIASNGNMAVSESLNHRITLFNSSGNFIKSVGARGFGEGQFNTPKGIAFDSRDRLLVADAFNHRIQILSADLEHVAAIKHDELFWPVALAVAPDGSFFVGDDSSKKVLEFDSLGRFVRTIGKAEGITLPLGVLATDSRIIITDDKEKTIEFLDRQLNRIETVAGIDDGTGLHVEFNESLAFDSRGELLFCDNRNRKVISYNLDTKEFSSFGDFGGFEDELSVLEVAVSPDGTIAVTDLVKHRVLVFSENRELVREITIDDFPE